MSEGVLIVTVTKAGLALCAALGIADCDLTDRTADELFAEWMRTRGPETIFFCNPRGCNTISGASRPVDLPPGVRCHVPLDYYNDAVTEYEDRGNYVFCDPALQS